MKLEFKNTIPVLSEEDIYLGGRVIGCMGTEDRMRTTEHRKTGVIDPIVIVFDGKRINPPAGYKYRCKWRNRFLPEHSVHHWMNGYAIWRPSNRAKVFVRR